MVVIILIRLSDSARRLGWQGTDKDYIKFFVSHLVNEVLISLICHCLKYKEYVLKY